MMEFYGSEGSLAFIIPFSFSSEGKKGENVCTNIFKRIHQGDDREQFDYYKDLLILAISKSFPNALNSYCDAIGQDESFNPKPRCIYSAYKGRNLCHCFSVCRKFHDDQSQGHPRLEIYLGSYPVHYEMSNKDDHFDFTIDTLLLLSNDKDAEVGYLVFNVSLASIHENMIEAQTRNSLDRIIFIKHLFYKNRLTCSIDGGSNISVREWSDKYYRLLLSTLKIESNKPNAGKTEEFHFQYSIVELNNIKTFPEETTHGVCVSVSDTDKFLSMYRTQLYGLLVSDEGWRYMPKEAVKLDNESNHWSSRFYLAAFFLGHNALIINQYNNAEVGGKGLRAYHSFSKHWYDNYMQKEGHKFYAEYPSLQPCVPGVGSLILFAYLKAVYKEMKLSEVKSLSDGNKFTDEEKYNKLANALQQHSMSLDAIRDIEDCIYAQFGIPAELMKLRERYQQEANNVQNKKVVKLTYITLLMSFAALIIATLALGLGDGNSIFSAGAILTYLFLILAWTITIASFYYSGMWEIIKKYLMVHK